MSGGEGQQGVQTQTVEDSPWEPQGDAFRAILPAVTSQITQNPSSFFPGSTTVPFDPATQQALAGTEQRAVGGSPLNVAAQQQAQNTLGGQYTDAGNPHLQGVMNNIQSTVQPAIASQFQGGNRYGSAGMQEAQARGMTEALAPYAFQDYGRERGYQQQAMTQAPGLANIDYNELARLGGVGAQREGLAGRELADQMQRHYYPQQEAQQRLGAAMGIAGGAPMGGVKTQTSPQMDTSGSPWMQAAGLGLSGLGMGNEMFGRGGMFDQTPQRPYPYPY